MNIYEAIADIMKAGYAVTKSKKNPQQGYQYRGIDDVMNTFQPLMAERGIFVVPEVLEATREERLTVKGTNLIYSVLKIRYTFYASDGSSVQAVVIGEGMDSGDKASNKAMAVAMKYALFQVFCVPTEEMQKADPDGWTPEPSRKKYVCDGCGKEILPYKDAKGRDVDLEAHKKRSQQLYGAVLCLDCIKGGTQNA